MSQLKASVAVLLASIACLCALGTATSSAAGLELHRCTKGLGTLNKRYSTSNCAPGTTVPEGAYTWKPWLTKPPVAVREASSFSLGATVGGVKFGVACSSLKGSGEIENTGGKAVGEGSMTLIGCVVSEPAEKGCEVPAEISTTSLKLETGESTVTYTPASGTKFTTVKVSGCSVSALNGEKAVTGTATAVVPEMGPQQFTSTSSALKFAEQKATFVGSFGLEDSGGGIDAFVAP
ncbi:MAG TPA: hypothetical protein VLL27_07730 [Solirubrobacterales bacterium]|nr:hypothetical protein [Solirubrobacterales bacterium]